MPKDKKIRKPSPTAVLKAEVERLTRQRDLAQGKVDALAEAIGDVIGKLFPSRYEVEELINEGSNEGSGSW